MSAPGQLPLSGRRVVVTRTHSQASALAAKLAALGAEAIQLPLIRITKEISKETLDDVLAELGSYDWIVFTSANGVRYFFQEFFNVFDDIRAMGLLRIACVGEGSARGLGDLHLRVDCRPPEATAEAMADALIATGGIENARILAVTGNLNRDTLVRKLEEAGAIVDRLQVYKTEKTDLGSHPGAANFRERGADAILFASSSAVQSFFDQSAALKLAEGARRPLAGSIGPQTSATMRKLGIPIDFEAKSPGFDELVQALVERLRP